MQIRRYIAGSLWAAALLLVVLIVSSVLWFSLRALGDVDGAQGAKGVALVSLVLSVLNFVALVVLLALAQLGCCEPPNESDQTETDKTE